MSGAAGIAAFTAVTAATQQEDERIRGAIRRRRIENEGGYPMNNTLLERCTGRECTLLLGTMGVSVKGTVLSISDNWLELALKKEVRLINLDYISGIRTHGE